MIFELLTNIKIHVLTMDTFYPCYAELRLKIILLINTVKILYSDHLWDFPKVVFKTTFGKSQRWSLIRDTLGEENEETNDLMGE